jgi:hypothetical protein
MLKCPYSCVQLDAGLSTCRFPNWWSHYAGVPRFLRAEYGARTEEDIFKVADAVVLFERKGSIYQGTAKIMSGDILVVKNTTWDRTVGKFFKFSATQEKLLCEQAENCPEAITGRYNRDRMVCLIRS